MFVEMLITLINFVISVVTRHTTVTVPVMLYYYACGNGNNGSGCGDGRIFQRNVACKIR